MSLSTTGIPQTAVRYSIDRERSTFTVRAFATGLLSAFGHNPTIAIPDLEGEVVFNSEPVEQSSLRLVIHAASLTVTDDIREKDRMDINRAMHEEVLESDSYADIIYECSHITASKNGDALRATGEFSVRQSDYDIRPDSAAAGSVKLKDELKLSFDIFARKQGR